MLMQSKETNFNEIAPHDRLAKVGEILARGICRLKEQEAKECEKEQYEPVKSFRHLTHKSK